ncbi:MAG: MATE family efflux transporter [Calditrichae bacterium]|nr:MATE family efflux transporter [Calditrichia bacterium]
MSERSKTAKLTQGPIAPLIIKMTFPMLIAIGGILVFNLTDTFFVGKLGKNPLAALTFTFPVVLFFGSLALGIGTGTSAVVSRAIGEGNHEKVKRLTTDSLILILLISVTTVTIGMLTVDFLFSSLGATGEILDDVKDYMYIWYPGAIFVMIPMVGNNAIRATGDTKTPSTVMLIAAGVNLVLDPIMIFGWGPFPEMGIRGAAWATLIARAVTLIAALYILAFREKMISFRRPAYREILSSFRHILKIGIPTAVSRILIPVGTGIITKMIASFGIAAVAAYGVGSRIEFFALAPVMALSSVIGPFVGQNAGAEAYTRIRNAVKGSYLFAVFWGLFAYLVLVILAPYAIQIFNDDAEVIRIGTEFLWIATSGFAFLGLLTLSGVVLNVLQKPIQSSVLSITQMFILYIPMAYFFSLWIGLKGIFIAYASSYLVIGIISRIIAIRVINYNQDEK